MATFSDLLICFGMFCYKTMLETFEKALDSFLAPPSLHGSGLPKGVRSRRDHGRVRGGQEGANLLLGRPQMCT